LTSNEINWLLFSLFVLPVLVQASAALVMLWTSCDKRPPGRESFRKALAIAVAALAAGAILYGVLGVRIGAIDFDGPPRGRLAMRW
jgi:hypothetical protein